MGLFSLAPVVARWPIRIAIKESIMKPSSKDAVAGKVHEVKGAVKEEGGATDKQARLGGRRQS